MHKSFSPLKKINIAKRLILYFSVILAVQMILIGWFSYSWGSGYIKDIQIKKMLEMNGIVVQEVNHMRSSMEQQSDRILSNINFLDAIPDSLLKNYDDIPTYEFNLDKNRIESILRDPTDMVNTIIIGQNGIIYQSRSGSYRTVYYDQITNTGIYKKSLESDGRNIWVATDEDIMTGNRKPLLYVCRTLISTDIKFKKLGQLIIQMPLNSLESVFQRSSTDAGEFYEIIDKNGVCIYNSVDKNLIGKKIDTDVISVMSDKIEGYEIINKGEKDYLITYSKYSGTGWDIVHVMPMHIITSSAEKIRNYILLIMLFSLVILLPLLIYLSRNISHPIKKLKDTVEVFGNGNLDARTEVTRMDEIGHLQVSFNNMAGDINNLLEKNAEENKQLRLMELNMIEYQINPHFLYNSLDSINWMAQKSGNEDIEEMVTALARFFRLGLSKGKEFYKVRDELEHVRQYLLINKIRFKDSFYFEVNADQNVMDYYTIKIILQPIVENAVKYGIDKNGTKGFIGVTAKRDENSIVFSVSDNGKGIPEIRLEAIRSVLAKHTQIEDGSMNGFGLCNVNQRIWMQFGEDYGITINSNVGNGTTVYVKVPLLQNK